jgi:hypothetical protein
MAARDAASSLDRAARAARSATEPTIVSIGDTKVRILPPMQWRQTAMRAIRSGDFDTWAQKVLVNDYVEAEGDQPASGSDDYAVWLEADPTNDELIEFFAEYEEASGSSLGK